ncbi:MAG: IS3 family transposase [Ginsengibacter sp.]
MNEVFALCGISRQAHNQAFQRHLQEQQKAALYVRSMEQVREIHPGMGLRTMYEMLQPDGIGRDAFVALGLQEGFRLKSVEKQTRTTYSTKSNRYGNLLGNVEFDGINQLWSSDITYLYCLDQFFYIVLIMDVYSRRLIGYSIADNMRAENNLAALHMALKLRGIENYHQSLIHHSDKGTQYASDAYTEALDKYEIKISMCNEVYENTHIERVNDTIKNQYLYRKEINNKRQLETQLNETIKAYNESRPHQSLTKMSPVEYENYLHEVPVEKTLKIKIYTVKLNADASITKQLNLFNKEI